MKKKEQKERDFERLVERQRQTIYSVYYLFANASASCIPFDRALILLWLENLPYNEIAAILGISIDNVSVRLVRVQGRVETDKQKTN